MMENVNKCLINIWIFFLDHVADHGICDHNLMKEIKIMV